MTLVTEFAMDDDLYVGALIIAHRYISLGVHYA